MTDVELPLVDMIVLGVVIVAIVRGIWIGLIREGLSLAAIGCATIVTRLLVDPFSIQLTELTGGAIAGKKSVWIAGILLVVATILLVGFLARMLRRGARFAGLGWADRIGGGALGAAEGAIVGVVVVIIALWIVGPDHAATAGARSIALVERLQSLHEQGELPAVASPGDWL
jgi:uncharacterized membrane protein required for colicin V production